MPTKRQAQQARTLRRITSVGRAHRPRRPVCARLVPFLVTALVTAMQVGHAAADLLRARDAWTKLTVDDAPAASFAFDDGTLTVTADGAVAFLYREVRDTTPSRVAWRWRVDEGIPATDPTRKGDDDRPIAVHLWFDTGDDDKTLYGTTAEWLGYPAVTHAITYVWGATQEAGTVLDNPYFERGRIVVLRRSATASNGWIGQSRDLDADLRRAFDGNVQARDLAYVVISADTDDQGGRSRARITDLRPRAAPSD